MTASAPIEWPQSSIGENCALILTPFGQDAGLIAHMLHSSGIEAQPFSEMGAFAREIPRCGVGILTTEALSPETLHALQSALRAQPAWSDIPLILLTAAIDTASYALLARTLGNVTIIQRPLDAASLLTVVQTALRARKKQYEIRDLIAAGEKHKAHIQELNEHLVLALDTARMGTWHLDLKTGALDCSERCKANFGLPEGASFRYEQRVAMIVPEDRGRMLAAIQQAIDGRSIYEMEYRINWPDGSVQWIVDSGRALYDALDSPVGMVGVTLKVTNRKRSEEALRASEERVRLATEAAGLGVWVWEPDSGRLTLENDRMAQIMGLPRTEDTTDAERLVGDVFHADDAVRLEREASTAIDTGEPFHFEGRSPRPDGEIRWIELTGRLQPATDDAPTRMVGTAADITERRTAEERDRQAAEDARAAAEANAKFRTFFEQGSYFAGVMTPDGTVVEANRLSLDACGYTREEVIGKKFWECGWWAGSPDVEEMVREATRQAAAGHLFQKETRYFVADGSERIVDLILAPVTDDAGRVLFIAPTGADITERKQAEQALAERAQEIACLNARLMRSMTETHHRVKNNLQLMAALVEMQLLDGADSVPVTELKRLRAHISTLATVHDILTRNARKEQDGATLSARAVLGALLPLMQNTTVGRKIRFELDDLSLSVRQCTSLAMVVNELVANALKHTRTDVDVLLTVQGDTVLLVVGDDGPGFAPDFDPARSAHTGLDLVLNLTRHDLAGKVSFDTRGRSGGCVRLTFPVVREERAAVR